MIKTAGPDRGHVTPLKSGGYPSRTQYEILTPKRAQLWLCCAVLCCAVLCCASISPVPHGCQAPFLRKSTPLNGVKPTLLTPLCAAPLPADKLRKPPEFERVYHTTQGAGKAGFRELQPRKKQD